MLFVVLDSQVPTNLEDGLFTPRLLAGLAALEAGNRLSNVSFCRWTSSAILTSSSSISLISTGMFTLFSHW
jgi:hypothetical protein